MKGLSVILGCVLFMSGCQSNDSALDSAFTGNQATYDLQSGSIHGVKGTVVFKERKDGAITSLIQLQGTSGSGKHPVHLHIGDLSTPDADIALLLNPVLASTGRSETRITMLADETTLTYSQLADFAASIKIHLGDVGADRSVILAAGNIGLSFTKANPTGRTGIAVCKSE